MTSESYLENRANQYIPELDGLRGIAILMVLLFHFCGWPIHLSLWGVSYGWAGVDLFFVLSGFLITTILLNTKDSPQYFASFYGRRVLRIFPLYFLALALYFYIEVPWLNSHGSNATVTVRDQLWCWFYLLNWRDVTLGMIGGLNHMWSLSIEEQFYLVWPLAVWLCSRKRVPLLCMVVIASSFLMRLILELNHADGEFLHRSTITRLDTLAFGGLVATIVLNAEWSRWLKEQAKVIAPAACGAFAIACLAANSSLLPIPYTLNYALLALIFSLLVFHCVTGTGGRSILCTLALWRPLRSIGKFSYSIYIFHAAVHRYLPQLIYEAMVRTGLTSWVPIVVLKVVGVVMCVAASYLIGVATWYLFEKHMLSLKKYFVYEKRPSMGISTAAATPELAE